MDRGRSESSSDPPTPATPTSPDIQQKSHDRKRVIDPEKHDGSEGADLVVVEAEKKLMRKIDWRLIPILWLLFVCAFMDRINIGNARIQGLEADLKMKGNDYSIALFTFFVSYILLEIPSNIMLRKLEPSVFLSGTMFGWGVITICQGVVQSFTGLVICRFLIGVFEAGFLPGAVYLISMYYRRHELQWRFNLFFCASIIAGAFSGLFAYALAHLAGKAGYSGWRWIFIVEGLVTVVIASISYFLLPDWPTEAKFLTLTERSLLKARLARDTKFANMDRLDRPSFARIFKDPKIYLGLFMYLGVVQTGYATSFFTPTILKQLGWTSIKAQVMSIPIFIIATVVALAVAYTSDKLRHRFSFIILGVCVATCGYGILLNTKHVHVGVRYLALYLITIGGYIAQPVIIVWLSNNVSGHYKRGISTAIQIGFGNVGGIVASNIYPPKQAPYYHAGFAIGLGFLWMTALAAVVLLLYMRRENMTRNSGKRDSRLSLPDSDNLGDDHPEFRFTY